MDDIAGCRLIFDSIPNLQSFRARFHTSGFKHRLRHEDINKYEYIEKPKL